MLQRPLIFLCLLIISFSSFSQEIKSGKITDLGIELQAYPTGFIPGLRVEMALSPRDALNLRVGYQIINHRDLGVHQEEKGNGYGFTLGYRHYIKDDLKGWLIGLRSDIWFNTIDWRDNIGLPTEIGNTTQVIVFQPTVEGGYLFELGPSKNWTITPALAFGVEINVVENGAPVGKGPVLLGGVTFGCRFL